MNTRPYHDKEVTLASLGGQGILESPDESDWDEGREIIEAFLDAGGVLIDTSPIYTTKGHERLSEKRFGEILPDKDRDSFILCTKTEERKKDAALEDLEKSLETLGLDYIDEWRLHHLDTMEEVDEIFADDGAIHAMEQALDEGLVLRPSISGHSDPEVLMEALKRYEFESVLGAINIADKFKYSFQEELIPYCEKNGIMFTGMKLLSRGKLLKKDKVNDMQECFNYALSVPGVTTAIIGIMNMEQLERLVELDESFEELNEEARKSLEDIVEPYAIEALYFRKGEEWPKDVDEEMPEHVL